MLPKQYNDHGETMRRRNVNKYVCVGIAVFPLSPNLHDFLLFQGSETNLWCSAMFTNQTWLHEHVSTIAGGIILTFELYSDQSVKERAIDAALLFDVNFHYLIWE